MPHSYYDRFADTPLGDRALRWFWGTEREPPQTPLHRFIPYALGGLARAGDLAFQSPDYVRYMLRGSDNPRKRLRFDVSPGGDYTTMSGAGGPMQVGGRAMWYSATPVLNHRYGAPGGRRYSKYGRVPRTLRMQYKLGRYLPLHITHEETTEVRAKAGSQAIVQFQAERAMPSYTAGGNPTGALNPSVNRRQDNSLGTYNGGITYNQIYRFAGATSDARSVEELTHRSDWTMFTNASWRDGLTAMNGRLSTGTLARIGYVTPFVGGTLHDATWYRRQHVDDVHSATDTVDPVYVFHATDYHHLTESISLTVTNNGTVPTHVTFYECILAHDVRFSGSSLAEDGTTTISWGALPDPVELWRAGRQINRGEQGGIKIVDGRAGMAAGTMGLLQGDDGEGAVGTRMGAPGAAVADGFDDGLDRPADIDAPNVHPGGPLLHHWYKVVPISRVVGPGMTTTFKVSVVFNKRIPGMWWESLAGVKGLSRTFFMVARPYKVVGSTGVDEVGVSGPGSRLMVMGATDLTMKWRKHKSFTRTDRPMNRRIYYRATIPEVDATAERDVNDGDLNGDVNDGGAAAGGDPI